jgi:hypothetical protein
MLSTISDKPGEASAGVRSTSVTARADPGRVRPRGSYSDLAPSRHQSGEQFQVARKLVEWLKRYGLPEAAGITTAYAGYLLTHAATASLVAASYGGALGENVGYYGVIVTRELHGDAGTARRTGQPYRWRGVLATFRNLFVEFGLAEFLDSILLRPLAFGLCTHYLGAGLGVVVGKLIADVTFYVPAIAFYELRKKWFGQKAAEPVQ